MPSSGVIYVNMRGSTFTFPLYLHFLAFSNCSRCVETAVRSLSVLHVISSAFAAVYLFNSRSLPHTHTCYSALIKVKVKLLATDSEVRVRFPALPDFF
jgi:hypothetical protein